jgi:hypothetical protein
MKRKSYRNTAVLAAVAVGASAFMAAFPATAQAADSDIVISEIMYHAPDPDITEFIELANKGSAAVDISGWGFTLGISINTVDGKFPSGTTIPAHGRIVGTADAASFQGRYGFTADFSYGVGGINGTNPTALSNGGEEITLVNSSAAVVDDLTYDDAVPWPLTPDGIAPGPSLELTDLNSDNSLAANWAASNVPYGTPRQINSVETAPPLTITDVATAPTTPAPNTAFTVNATVEPGAAASLTYKIMYGSDVTIPMADDAASAGGAGDGTFSATVPGAGPGLMVRYKIAASHGAQTANLPVTGDQSPYLGVVVDNPGINAQFPVFNWFMTPADLADLLANHRCDDVTHPAAVSYNGQFLDNAAVRVKGQSSCSDPKAKWDFTLPSGHLMSFGPAFAYPLDEFALNNEHAPIPGLGWKMIGDSGDPTQGYQMFRTQLNGAFYSVVAMVEKLDNQWRDHHGYGDWAMYKADAGGLRTYATPALLAASLDLDKKTPSDGDFTDAWNLTQMLSAPDTPGKRAWMWDNLDMSEMANYTALTVAMRHWDSGGKNFYIVRDTNGSGRWQILSWDLDGIFNGGSDTKGDFVIPDTSFNKLYASLFAIPEFRAMHFRRVRTLHDQLLAGSTLVNQFDAWTTCCVADVNLDKAKWGGPSVSTSHNKVVAGVQERRNQIAAHTNATEIPTSQVAAPNVVINEIQYAPIPNGDAEYVELYNPANTSVDISGWVLTGVGDYVMPPGTVLLAHGFGVVTRDDVAFRAAYGSGKYVIGQYDGKLDNSGDDLALMDGTRTVDAVSYLPTAPWPVEANGTGPSLELNDPALDNSDPANWHASSNAGTPDATNTGGGGGGTQTVVLPFGSSWKYLATGPDQGTAWSATGFNDTSWASGTGDLGFKNGNHTIIPSTTNRVTYYFRTTVNLAAGNPVTALDLSLLRDDGAVIYINGVEVARSNMATGTVTFTKKASASVDGAAETTPVSISLPPGALTVGSNSVAIEVHQKASGAAGDLTMDAQLTVTR